MRQEPTKSVIKIRIDGKPIPRKSMRTTKNGRLYDSQKKEKRDARIKAMQQMRENGAHLRCKGPLHAEIAYHTPMPASWSQKRKERENGKFHESKPDVDNCTKFYLDVLNDLAYADDKQVAKLSCEKRYSYEPRTEIKISEL